MFRAEQAIGEDPDKTGYVLRVPDSDGARGITERNVRIGAVLLERTMTLLNCRDPDIDDKRQIPMHRIQRAGVLPRTRQASLPGVSRAALDVLNDLAFAFDGQYSAQIRRCYDERRECERVCHDRQLELFDHDDVQF